MATIDTRPEVVNIYSVSGNTLTIKVRTPVLYTVGMEWTAQVRSTSNAATVDAEFVVTPGTSPDPQEAVTYLSLSSSVTAHLCHDHGVLTKVRPKGSTVENTIMRYTGQYDIQLSGPGGTDPVITVGSGELIIDLDVTRAA